MILVIVGLVIRAKVPESPVFEEVRESGSIVKSPIAEVLKTDWRNILRGIGLRIAETAGYAVSITYMISYLKSTGLASASQTLTALCIASALGIFATFGWATLTDKIGRRPVYIAVTAFGIPFGILMFTMVNTGQMFLYIASFVIAYGVCQNALAGAQGGWFPELFNANTRSSGASLA
jgi:MFS family permease